MDAAHYHCRACDDVFPADRVSLRVGKVRSEFWGEVAVTEQCIELCPECGSENLEPIHLCVECHEAPSADGTDRCNSCIAAEEAAWDARIAKLKAAPPKLTVLASLREAITDITGAA